MNEEENKVDCAEKWWKDLALNTLTPQEATEILRAMGMKISGNALRDGIGAGVFPFGVSYETKNGGLRVFIFEEQFKRWVSERAKTIVRTATTT